MQTVELQAWTERGGALLARAEALLKSSEDEDVQALASELPQHLVAPEESVRVVVAGQYSAGKSSLIKALTSREDVAIGASITTETANEYEWNGLTIVDTPGVHTELRPDHDEVTYEAISAADLLIFVVTNELFDSHLAQHFRNLAVEHSKGHEMLLVVNKMQRCARGNTPEMRDIISGAITEVIDPFTTEDLRVSFVDADLALRARHEDGPLASVLARKSGFDDFIAHLNRFVQERGLVGRYTTALYQAEHALQQALTAEPSDDRDLDQLKELLLQQKRALLDVRAQMRHATAREIQKTTAQIRASGREVAELIHGDANAEEIEQKLVEAQQATQQLMDQLALDVERIIEDHMSGLEERLGDILDSDFARVLLPRIEARETPFSGEGSNAAHDKHMKLVASGVKSLGKNIIEHTFSGGASGWSGLSRLGNYSGTKGHQIVKDVGHFFGKKFKPWEAIKWTKTVANVGRALNVAGVVFSVALQFREDSVNQQREHDLKQNRAEVRAAFVEVAGEVDNNITREVDAFIASVIDAQLAQISEGLRGLTSSRQNRSARAEEIVVVLGEVQKLIMELHGARLSVA